MILAGIPPTTAYGGTSFVTTAPAATIEPSPSVTPLVITAPEPIQTLLPILMGAGTSPLLSGSFIASPLLKNVQTVPVIPCDP